MPRKGRQGRKGHKGRKVKIDASRSTFNVVGGDQINQELIDGRTYHKRSIVENMHFPSDHTIILMMACFCISVAFMTVCFCISVAFMRFLGVI
jgi:hypothetical protein